MARSDYESLTREELLEVVIRQDARIAQLEARIKQLEDLLDKATRGGKRQAAPFSKGGPKSNPKKPGRKSGKAHGRHGHRLVYRVLAWNPWLDVLFRGVAALGQPMNRPLRC